MNKKRKKQSLRRITLLFICLLVVGYLFTVTDLFAQEEPEQGHVDLPPMKNYLEGGTMDEDELVPDDNNRSLESINTRNLALDSRFSLISAAGIPQRPSVLPEKFAIAFSGNEIEKELYEAGSETPANQIWLDEIRDILITNIGFDSEGNLFHARFRNTTTNARLLLTNFPHGITIQDRVTVGFPTISLIANISYEYPNGEPLSEPVLQGYDLFSRPLISFNNSQVSSILATDYNRPRLSSTISGETLRFAHVSGTRGIFYVIIEPEYTVTISNINTSTFSIFRLGESPLNTSFSRLGVHGKLNESNFISEYEITQQIPGFPIGGLNITIDNPDVFEETTVQVLTIKDSTGTDLSNRIDTTIRNNQIIFSIDEETVKSLSGGKIEIGLKYPIDKLKEIEYYLEGDYLEIGIEASNSRSSVTATDTAQTWVRPWGEPVSQEIYLDTSTNELDPQKFIENLDNKLEGDEPYVVGFSEDRTFDRLEDTSIGVVIESTISGIQNTIDVPVTVIESKGSVIVHHLDKEGKVLADSEELIGIIGEPYETKEQNILNYQVVTEPENALGIFSEEVIEVTYIYEIAPVMPVDPTKPESEVDPENSPLLPEGQGLLSIDFISSFNFGVQAISAHARTYYAQPQRLLNDDGTVNENEERPNYVQISDRRSASERNGWQLAVTQKEQFKGENDQELTGARIQLTNQQLATAQGSNAPELQQTNPLALVPGNKRILLMAQGDEGMGTWIYRFGDEQSAGSSVVLDVPRGATPDATSYSTTLTWELSAVPAN